MNSIFSRDPLGPGSLSTGPYQYTINKNTQLVSRGLDSSTLCPFSNNASSDCASPFLKPFSGRRSGCPYTRCSIRWFIAWEFSYRSLESMDKSDVADRCIPASDTSDETVVEIHNRYVSAHAHTPATYGSFLMMLHALL